MYFGLNGKLLGRSRDIYFQKVFFYNPHFLQCVHIYYDIIVIPLFDHNNVNPSDKVVIIDQEILSISLDFQWFVLNVPGFVWVGPLSNLYLVFV